MKNGLKDPPDRHHSDVVSMAQAALLVGFATGKEWRSDDREWWRARNIDANFGLADPQRKSLGFATI